MKDLTKMGLGAMAMVLLSNMYIGLLGFSNQITEPTGIAAIIVVVALTVAVALAVANGATAVVVAAAVVAAAGVVAVGVVAVGVAAAGGVTVVGVATGVVAITIAGVVGVAVVAATWDKEKKEVTPLPFFLLVVVFALPLIPGTYYLSRYHNYFNQIPKDQQLAEILEVARREDGFEVKLPSEYAGEHRYLGAVLSFHFGSPAKKSESAEIERYYWRKNEVYCQEREKVWYMAKLPFPKEGLTTPTLWAFFDHVWEDFEVKLPIKITP